MKKKQQSLNTAAQVEIAQGQGHAAWTKPVLKSQPPGQANRLVIYHPEKIALNKDSNTWEVEVIFMDSNSVTEVVPQKIALNDLVLSKAQRQELKSYERYHAAIAAYEPIVNLAGSGNYALTKQSLIAKDDFVSSVYEPNQLVRFLPETISYETDNGSIDFFEVSIIYVNLKSKIHAISLDKLILSDIQMKKLKNLNYRAYSWYKKQHKLSAKNVCIAEH